MVIQLVLNKSYEKAIYEVTSKNMTAIHSKENPTTFFVDYPVKTEISFFKTASAAAAAAAAESASYVSVGMTAVLMLVSFNAALILIKLFQMLEFFVYINVDLPLNVQNFIAYFDQNIFDMIPNPL